MRYRGALVLLPLNARRREKALAPRRTLYSVVVLLLFRRGNVAALYALGNERLYNALLRRELLFRHFGHGLASRQVHRPRIAQELAQLVGRYLAVLHLVRKRVKVHLPALVLRKAHVFVNARVHYVGDLAAAALQLGRQQARGVFKLVNFKAGLAARVFKGTVLLHMLAVAQEIPAAALAARKPAAAFDKRVYLKVYRRLKPAGHIHARRSVLHLAARNVVAVELLRQPVLHVGESVHRYLVGQLAAVVAVGVVLAVVEVRQQILYDVL